MKIENEFKCNSWVTVKVEVGNCFLEEDIQESDFQETAKELLDAAHTMIYKFGKTEQADKLADIIAQCIEDIDNIND